MHEPDLKSLQNPQLKACVHLRRRSVRDREKKFIVEGYRELSRALDALFPIEKIFFCREFFLGNNEDDLLKKAQGRSTQLLSCSADVFRKLSYRDRPDGLLGIAPQKKTSFEEIEKQKKGKAFFVVAESIEKPGNLGTLLRSADAVAADAVFVCDPCTDIYNPNVVRASIGTLFTVPVLECSLVDLLSFFQKHSVLSVAATPQAQKMYTQADFKLPLALMVGSEQYGLSSSALEAADLKVRIPMRGKVDSLNVATAASILLYEVLRQRQLD